MINHTSVIGEGLNYKKNLGGLFKKYLFKSYKIGILIKP